eukprot:COSAG02_NODE_318_length_24799_cov_9.884615_3_plen_240_part_00
MASVTAAAPSAAAEEGLPPPPAAETTGLLESGGANDEDPKVEATEPRLPRLLVRQMTGEQTTLHLSLNDTIGALKEAVCAEWSIEADAQRLLLANSAAAGDAEAGGEGGGRLPLEEDEAATLRACGLADGAELLLTLQDAVQGARRRELREAARREAAERAELSRREAAERAELSVLRGDEYWARARALTHRPMAELTAPEREFVDRHIKRSICDGLCACVITLALCAVLWMILHLQDD